MEARGQWLVQQCVLPSSQITYSTGWRRWLRYTSELQLDPYLVRSPSGWDSTNRVYSFPVAVTLNYLFQLFVVDNLAAATISVYLASLRYHFICANRDINWMSSVAITKARSALYLMCRQRKAEREVGKLPFTLDLIELYRSTHPLSFYRYRAVYTAMRLAHLLMLRISEYTRTPHADHHMRGADVMFQVQDGSYVLSSAVTPNLTHLVTGVVIDIRSAKNDSKGSGHRFFFPHHTSSPDRCICSLLWEWSLLAKPPDHLPFFSYRGIWELSASDVSSAMKTTAVRVGLDPSRISPHSLRYGGASTLAAANRPSYLIQQIGRWKSLAFLQYIQMSTELLTSAQAAASDPAILTFRDIQLLHPGCRIPT